MSESAALVIDNCPLMQRPGRPELSAGETSKYMHTTISSFPKTATLSTAWCTAQLLAGKGASAQGPQTPLNVSEV